MSMTLDAAAGVDTAWSVQAWIAAIRYRTVTRLVQRTIVVGYTAWFRWLDAQTSALVRVSFVFRWTGAFIAAGQIHTVCSLATRCDFHAFIDVDTVIIRCDAEASGTNAEAILAADVNTFFVMPIAGIRRGAVVACPEAVVKSMLEIRGATTVTIKTQ